MSFCWCYNSCLRLLTLYSSVLCCDTLMSAVSLFSSILPGTRWVRCVIADLSFSSYGSHPELINWRHTIVIRMMGNRQQTHDFKDKVQRKSWLWFNHSWSRWSGIKKNVLLPWFDAGWTRCMEKVALIKTFMLTVYQIIASTVRGILFLWQTPHHCTSSKLCGEF